MARLNKHILQSILCRQQPTGGVDVLSARGTDGGDNTLFIQRITEPGHGGGVGALQRDAWNGVILDQIETATRAAQQTSDFLDMVLGGVKVLEDDVFKRKAALSVPVVLPDGMNHFLDGIGLLDGHQLKALVVEGAVHTDGKVAFRLLQETF